MGRVQIRHITWDRLKNDANLFLAERSSDIDMKVLLDIKDNKAAFFMEMLQNFSFVKATTLTESKAEALKEFKEAVDEVKLAKEGKIKLPSARDFLNELED